MTGGLSFLARMAWRDLRAQPSRWIICALSISLGVGSLVALSSLRLGFASMVEDQSLRLLGADVVISSRRPFPAGADAYIEGLDATSVREISFRSMVYFPSAARSRLVEVRAIDGSLPLYGEAETEPRVSGGLLPSPGSIIADRNLLYQFGVAEGDAIQLGESTFRVEAALRKAPGESPAESFIAPRIYVPKDALAATGLLQPGSVATYRVHLRRGPTAPDGENIRNALRSWNLDVQTAERRRKQLVNESEGLSRFLGLVGFAALVLGCLGVVSAVHAYTRESRASAAILECLGATAAQARGVFVVATAMVTAFGTALGIGFGFAVQAVLPVLLRDFLPVELSRVPAMSAVMEGTVVGFGLALLSAWWPLRGLRDVSPLGLLRADIDPVHDNRTDWFAAIVLTAGAAVAGAWLADVWWHGIVFALGVVILLCVLMLAGLGLRAAARSLAPSSLAYELRQGIANLNRPRNQTLFMTSILGLCICTVVTLGLLQDSLLARLALPEEGDQPNTVLIDVQTDQRDVVSAAVKALGMPVQHLTPIVPMRITKLAGRTVRQIEDDPGLGIPDWTFRREYRSTYRASLSPTERLMSGAWQRRFAATNGPVPISMEEGIVESLKLKLGDPVTFDVQGLMLDTYVASIREVDWQSMQPNFFVVFPTGVLEDAPQSFALFSRVDSDEQMATLQRTLADDFPTLTVIDISMVLESVRTLVTKMTSAIKFLAVVAAIAGLLVLVNALNAGGSARRQEMRLLHVLGGTRNQLRTVALAELTSLALLGIVAGTTLALLASWLMAVYLFEMPLALSFATLLVPGTVAMVITLVAGLRR